jgi:P-type Cu2+ transporter
VSAEAATVAPRRAAPEGGRARVSCAHCALPVPAGLVRSGEGRQFCCEACRTVFEALHGCGLERYYELRDRQGASGRRARFTGRGFEEFDDDGFLALYSRELGEGVRSAELFLEGVHCVACVWLVEKLPELVPGVLEARLDLGRSLVRLVWEERSTRLSAAARALDRLGYVAHPARGAGAREARRREDREFLTRVAVAGALAGNAMLLAGALYFGIFGGIEQEFRTLFRWAGMAIAGVSLVWPGRVFFRGALTAIRTRSRHLDLPIAIGLTGGMAVSVAGTVSGAGEVYFDTITTLVFLLLCGRWIQHRQQRSATDAVEMLYALTPSRARLWEGGRTRDVPVDALTPGVTVEVRADESFPADGVVVEGQTSVDQSILTGESRPVAVGVGQPVSAGAVNLASRVLVRVRAAGAETRVGRLMRLVEEASVRRAPIVTAADRIAGWFVLAVLSLSVLTFVFWSFMATPGIAVGHALALLIITCPCALGMATPLAVTVAVGRAARGGIMIKGGLVLERLSRPGVIFLDKTGTITEGRQRLVSFTGDATVRAPAAALERASAHPVARALASSLAPEATPSEEVSEVRQVQGCGIEGVVGGMRLRIGSAPWVLARAGGPFPAELERAAREAADRGLTPVVIARDDSPVAVAALGDALREDAPEAVERLRRAGWSVRVLSGDDPRVVRAVAAQLGIPAEDARGGVTPEQKVEAIEEAAAATNRPVVMVGDGVNDAAALARAGVGVAVRGGAEASLAAADVYLRAPGLGPIVELCLGSRRAVRAIHRNLAVSLAYNVIGAGLAVTGSISALSAAVLMPLSGLTVLTLALRARTFGARRLPLPGEGDQTCP